MFSEVDVIGFVPPNDPTYRKPDIGTLCVIKRKMLIKWNEIPPFCIRSQHFPDRCTDIASPIGLVTVDMPFEEVVRLLKISKLKQCNFCGEPL